MGAHPVLLLAMWHVEASGASLAKCTVLPGRATLPACQGRACCVPSTARIICVAESGSHLASALAQAGHGMHGEC